MTTRKRKKKSGIRGRTLASPGDLGTFFLILTRRWSASGSTSCTCTGKTPKWALSEPSARRSAPSAAGRKKGGRWWFSLWVASVARYGRSESEPTDFEPGHHLAVGLLVLGPGRPGSTVPPPRTHRRPGQAWQLRPAVQCVLS